MVSLLLILALFINPADSTDSNGSIPDTLDVSMIRNFTSYFSLEGPNFVGADSLVRQAKEAQFVALGEIHNSRRLSEFTSALMHLLEPEGYQNLIVETGPYSAEKLESLIASKEGKEAVSVFYDRYSSKLFQYYVIPFFTGKGDLEMLQTTHELGYNLIGIDQEYAFSTIFLSEELKSRSDEPLTDEQLGYLDDITSKLPWWYRRSQVFSSFDLSCSIKNYEPFKKYVASFTDPNRIQKKIIDALMVSLDIYCLNESGKWSEGNQKRINYFKSNFDAFYERASNNDTGQLPKAIVKMGSYHSGRYKSPNGIYDIGNHVAELTDSLGTKSLHLRFLNRYFEDGRDVMGEKNWSASTRFITVGERNRWALIDTRELRKQMLEKKLVGSRFEMREIINYDYILIMPEDVRAVKHY